MKYRIEDTIIDTSKASQKWEEATDWNGNNNISRATGSQWTHETLYRSRKGRYYLVYESQWQGSSPSAEFISNADAARWLLQMEHDLPADLEELEEAITE